MHVSVMGDGPAGEDESVKEASRVRRDDVESQEKESPNTRTVSSDTPHM